MITKFQYNNNLELIKALRSGKYEQTQGVLRDQDTDTFCCLGVACDIVNPEKWKEAKHETRYMGYKSANDYGQPPASIHTFRYGWKDSEGATIEISHEGQIIEVSMLDANDRYKLSFDEIADALEDWLDKQEVKK